MQNFYKKVNPKIEINIGDKVVLVSYNASIKDIKTFDGSKDLEPIEIVRRIISNHIDEENKYNLDNISNESINDFIHAYIESDENLKNYYNNSSAKNKIERFVEALHLYAEDFHKKTKENFRPIEKQIKNLEHLAEELSPKVDITLPTTLVEVSESISQVTKYWQSILQAIFKPPITEVIDSARQTYQIDLDFNADFYTDFYADLSAVFDLLNKTLEDIVRAIPAPSLSQEQKEDLQEKYKAWGKYGWTEPPNAPSNIFKEYPESLEEANKCMKQYTNKASVNKLFLNLRGMGNIKKDDLEEAILNFEDRRYKSCVMILFALIDGKIIRNKNNYSRKTGIKGFDRIYQRFEPELKEREAFLFLISLMNVTEALKATYAHGDNFKEQPVIINRNFVLHGMLIDKVGRRDVIQLFLLLYNLSLFI